MTQGVSQRLQSVSDPFQSAQLSNVPHGSAKLGLDVVKTAFCPEVAMKRASEAFGYILGWCISPIWACRPL